MTRKENLVERESESPGGVCPRTKKSPGGVCPKRTKKIQLWVQVESALLSVEESKQILSQSERLHWAFLFSWLPNLLQRFLVGESENFFHEGDVFVSDFRSATRDIASIMQNVLSRLLIANVETWFDGRRRSKAQQDEIAVAPEVDQSIWLCLEV